MTIKFSYVFNADSFTFFESSGIVKSVQANLRGENDKDGFSHEITILAILPTAQPRTPTPFNDIVRVKAEKWLEASLEPGLLRQYKEEIANGIDAARKEAAEKPPEKESTGIPEAIE